MELPVIVVRGEGRRVDAERIQQAGGHAAIGAGAVDAERAAIDQLDFAAKRELVALGVTAKIVMVVEDQDAGGGTRPGTVEIGGGEAADPATNDDQVVMLPRFDWRGSGFQEGAVTQRVGGLETAGVAAPHSGQRGRVIAGTILRCRDNSVGITSGEHRRRRSSNRRDRDPVDEIAPRDRPAHAEAARSFGTSFEAGYPTPIPSH
jgi:hypothetical protein